MEVQKQIKLSSICLKIMSAKPNKNSNVVRILLQIITSDSHIVTFQFQFANTTININ